MIHRQRNLLADLLYHEIDLPAQLYLIFFLSLSLFVLSFTFTNTKIVTSPGTVLGAESPSVSLTQEHLSTMVDGLDPDYYLVTIHIKTKSKNASPLTNVRLQGSLTTGWQNFEPKISSLHTTYPLSKNVSYDGYATSVLNSPDDVLYQSDEAEAIVEIRVRQPLTTGMVENIVILQANYDGQRIIQQSVLPIELPGKTP